MARRSNALAATGCPAPPGTSAAPPTLSQYVRHRCALLVDRHVHKTGGTTLRRMFLHNECRDQWTYLGYGLEWADWSLLLQELTVRNSTTPTAARFLVEAHYPAHAFHTARLHALAAQRERLRGGCAIALMTRVRAPLAFYWSFFVWSHRGGSLSASLPAVRDSFWAWARAAPNLQANILWDAAAAAPAEHSALRPEQRRAAYLLLRPFNATTYAQLSVVLKLYDIVGTVEQWDAALLLAAERVGLRHLAYPRPSSGCSPEGRVRCPPALEAACPEDSRAECEARIRGIAPLDHRRVALYRAANRTFTRLRAAAGGAFEQRLSAFQRQLDAFQTAYHERQQMQANRSQRGRFVLRDFAPCHDGQQNERCRKRAARITDQRCDFANLAGVKADGGIRRPTGAQRLRAADVILGMTSTQQQMQGGRPSFREGGIMEGNFRDEDGVDRVEGPPDELKPLLLLLKENAIGEGIDLAGEFESAGAKSYGVISRTKFESQLVRTYKRFRFTDDLLYKIACAYGTGLPDRKWGGFKDIAWKDFVEDIMKSEGSLSTTAGSLSLGAAFGGKSRDADGSVDRVPDPPEALKKWLLTLKLKNVAAGVDFIYSLRGAGAAPNGTIKKHQFLLCLQHTYKEFKFSENLLFSLAHAYGCGDPDPIEGAMTHIAWRDFCEDVDAQDLREVTPEIDAYCRGGSAFLG
ncbi:hypothetical protein AB1Y20_010085 [Prymnesium parvum]|uniref:Uncharacterized protein n=1 Tax=Prymnesium parvum TaxID=97485 RepID=A0AB34K405_PRYPA